MGQFMATKGIENTPPFGSKVAGNPCYIYQPGQGVGDLHSDLNPLGSTLSMPAVVIDVPVIFAVSFGPYPTPMPVKVWAATQHLPGDITKFLCPKTIIFGSCLDG